MEIKYYNMEIKDNTKELLPKKLDFENHFLIDDKLNILSLDTPQFFKQAEISWKEIENFEFQKMDINASFENLIKRI